MTNIFSIVAFLLIDFILRWSTGEGVKYNNKVPGDPEDTFENQVRNIEPLQKYFINFAIGISLVYY